MKRQQFDKMTQRLEEAKVPLKSNLSQDRHERTNGENIHSLLTQNRKSNDIFSQCYIIHLSHSGKVR